MANHTKDTNCFHQVRLYCYRGSVEYNEENLEAAERCQRNMKADMGGTEIYQALRYIYEQDQHPGFARQVGFRPREAVIRGGLSRQVRLGRRRWCGWETLTPDPDMTRSRDREHMWPLR